ncbi:MAG TPA: SRPBCC family protein [Solirubrobacteraceae bacterium]
METRDDALTTFLGWFSLGLGVPQVVAPGRVCRAVGVRDDDTSRFWMRLVGVRELAAAAGILGQRRPAPWLWARVAGDAMDLTLLAAALVTKRERAARIVGAMGSVAGITVADVVDAIRLGRQPETGDETVRSRFAVTVRRDPEEVYGFWHDLENLPRFMKHLESVQVTGDRRSHWSAHAPVARTVEWDAEIVEDRPGERIAWRSVDPADVRNSGSVRFSPAPGERGTEVRLDMEYTVPGGTLGLTVAKLLGEAPEQQARDDLQRFKQVMEAGVIARSEATPEGMASRRLLRQRPAQPPPEPVGAGAGSHDGSSS